MVFSPRLFSPLADYQPADGDVIVLLGPWSSGIWSYMLTLAHNLADYGIGVTLADAESSIFDHVGGPGVTIFNCATGSPERRVNYLLQIATVVLCVTDGTHARLWKLKQRKTVHVVDHRRPMKAPRL